MKRLSDQTLYEIIEISVDAPPEEIERACDRAAATYGPGSLATYTLASAEETALLSSRIEEARAVLLDPSARSRYDERIGVRAASPSPEPEADRQAGSTPVPLAVPTTWPPPEPEPSAAHPRPVSPGLPIEAAPAPPGDHLPSLPVEPAPAAPAVESVRARVEASATTPPRALPASAFGPAGDAARPAETAPGAATAPPPVTPGAPAPIALTRPVTPILLEREVAAPREPVVTEGSAWTGEMLRQVRESRGFTVQQMAERTRITRHHLENIEQDRFKALPAPVYLRGIIMSLARELRLDGQKVARSYLERMGASTDGEPRP